MQNDHRQVQVHAFLLDLLSVSFGYPGEELYQSLIDGSYAEELAEQVARLPQGHRYAGLVQQLASLSQTEQLADYHQLESEYISLFEHNKALAPLRLYAHLYTDGEPQPVPVYQRLKTMYRDFEIELAVDRATEQPDHISVQLEFFAYLHRLLLEDNEPRSLQKINNAISDFCQELAWVSVWAAQLKTRPAHIFYQTLAECLLLILNEICGRNSE